MPAVAEQRQQLRARLLEAGATLSTGVDHQRLHLTAWTPADADKALLNEARAAGWIVVTGKPMQWLEAAE